MGYVYLIGTSTFGWYKIGKSKIPKIRVNSLGILLPFKVNVIAIWKAQDHHLMESSLHEMYTKSKINGEWFEFTKKEVQDLIERIPSEARVYPGVLSEKLESFTNVDQDTRKNKTVIGVRVQKLRGNFTPEEREQKRQAAIEKQRLKKLSQHK
jgi:hypothetical protein